MPTKQPDDAKKSSSSGVGRRQSEDFESPREDSSGSDGTLQGGGDSDEDAESSEWAEPSGSGGAETAALDTPPPSAVSAELLELRDAVAKAIAATLSAASEAGVSALQDVEGANNIQAVGISEADPESGAPPGEPVLTLYVAEPVNVDEAKAALVDSMGVSAASSDDVALNVVHSRHFDAFSHRAKFRPAPAGVSISHCKVTAGTLGGWTRGAPGTARYNRLLLLSNNHVIANSNSASYGDPIIQPGTFDGGKCPADRIAILERFVRINFSGPCNYVDAATGWCWPNLVRRDYVYWTGSGWAYFRVGNAPVAGYRNLWVGKTGRTTQLTRGYITDVNWSGRVNYGGGRVAMFCDQIVIRAASGNFSAGGDSGSLIWTWDSRRAPVALLFAGGGGLTIANKIQRVLPSLGIVFANA